MWDIMETENIKVGKSGKYNPNLRIVSECHENEFIRIILIVIREFGAFG